MEYLTADQEEKYVIAQANAILDDNNQFARETVSVRYQGEFLEGQAIVRNKKKATVSFESKFEWFDDDGFPVESNVSHWKPDLLYGKETKWIKSICPKPNAKGFKVMIREPNPIEE